MCFPSNSLDKGNNGKQERNGKYGMFMVLMCEFLPVALSGETVRVGRALGKRLTLTEEEKTTESTE